ncbi:unnamed protein product [Acanthosepion pharaonis]|uniref:Uncharacterized protein n=1 Tax=Acanthosepion pharaonis TaxID=158019 RepID=A0A812BLG0_ACAPH|nr:unnamed protein product [Sepia pharaonis]
MSTLPLILFSFPSVLTDNTQYTLRLFYFHFPLGLIFICSHGQLYTLPLILFSFLYRLNIHLFSRTMHNGDLFSRAYTLPLFFFHFSIGLIFICSHGQYVYPPLFYFSFPLGLIFICSHFNSLLYFIFIFHFICSHGQYNVILFYFLISVLTDNAQCIPSRLFYFHFPLGLIFICSHGQLYNLLLIFFHFSIGLIFICSSQ